MKKTLKKKVRGVLTVEMSFLIPIILLIFVVVIETVFYYHDKNILLGAAAETAVVGAQTERKPDEAGETDLSAFYQERIEGKLIFFSGAAADISKQGGRIQVEVTAKRNRMKIHIVQQSAVTEPEKTIRRVRLLKEKLQENADE